MEVPLVLLFIAVLALAFWMLRLEAKVDSLIAILQDRLHDIADALEGKIKDDEDTLKKAIEGIEDQLTADLTEEEAQAIVEKAIKDAGLSGTIKAYKVHKKKGKKQLW